MGLAMAGACAKHRPCYWSQTLNSHGKCAEKSCELSEPILCYVFINGRELCPQQACKLSGACELARVKLLGLYCNALTFYWNHLGCVNIKKLSLVEVVERMKAYPVFIAYFFLPCLGERQNSQLF